MDEDVILRQVEELHLLQCSLLPDETLHFIDNDSEAFWPQILHEYSVTTTISDSSNRMLKAPPKFQVRLDGPARMWMEVEMVASGSGKAALVSVKGDYLTRANQERWQNIVAEKRQEVEDSEYPIYELLSLHLLPLLHEEKTGSIDECQLAQTPQSNPAVGEQQLLYHTLLTSHHLVSPNKRRSLQEWSSSLSVSGFAKVGYPGVIYAQGERGNIEQFVANVKSMQWLALRVRFVEALVEAESVVGGTASDARGKATWREFQKVGEVVEEMKRLGREKYVTEVGIGSAVAK